MKLINCFLSCKRSLNSTDITHLSALKVPQKTTTAADHLIQFPVLNSNTGLDNDDCPGQVEFFKL